MITPLMGGVLSHSCALVYEGNKCLHGCAYCFSNINDSDRCGSIASAVKFLNKKERHTFADALFMAGLPICVSNKTDPFSPNARRDTEMLFTELAKVPNGVFIQTKTGEGCEDIIDILGKDKAVVYVTVSILNEDVRRVVEPNAPPAEFRLDVMERLRKKGYLVIAAINPCNETWLPPDDVIALLCDLRRRKIKHLYVEPLNISPRRFAKMSPARADRLLGAEKTQGIGFDDIGCLYASEVAVCAMNGGFAVQKDSLPYKSDFDGDVKRILKNTMPTMMEYINECFDRKGDSEYILLTFKDFYEWASRDNEIFRCTIKQNDIRGYLLRDNFNVWKANPQVHSFEHLWNILWNNPVCKSSPARHTLLYPAAKNGRPLKDENGDAVYYFDGVFTNERKEVKEL